MDFEISGVIHVTEFRLRRAPLGSVGPNIVGFDATVWSAASRVDGLLSFYSILPHSYLHSLIYLSSIWWPSLQI